MAPKKSQSKALYIPMGPEVPVDVREPVEPDIESTSHELFHNLQCRGNTFHEITKEGISVTAFCYWNIAETFISEEWIVQHKYEEIPIGPKTLNTLWGEIEVDSIAYLNFKMGDKGEATVACYVTPRLNPKVADAVFGREYLKRVRFEVSSSMTQYGTVVTTVLRDKFQV